MSTSVVYQPCTDKVARKNLQGTILNPVRLEDIQKYLTTDLVAMLWKENPSGNVHVWGVVPSKTTDGPWKAMQRGDVVVFNTQGTITVTARFTHRTHNRALAIHLWGMKDAGENTTWENIYFASDIRSDVAIPYPKILSVTHKKPRMSFYRFPEDDGESILANNDLVYENPGAPIQLEEALDEIKQQMEADGTATRRTRNEHRYIVQHLFKNAPSGTCCICQKEFPRNMLVAAHIKKRAACSNAEKLDIKNIAAAMCRMGCDPLFEFGYISVKDGCVIKHPSLTAPASMAAYIEDICGGTVAAWNGKTEKYFEWHRSTHGFEPGIASPATAAA